MQQVTIQDKTFGVFLPEKEIDAAIARIAEDINREYAGKNPIFISILNGAFMFTADLLKKIWIPCELSFVKLASYAGTSSTGQVKELMGLKEDIRDRSVIVLEDIVDTGLTLESILEQLKGLHPRSVAVATLLQKPECLKVPVNVDYTGFQIPDKFVVGYGLDLDGYGRNLPDIYQLIP